MTAFVRILFTLLICASLESTGMAQSGSNSQVASLGTCSIASSYPPNCAIDARIPHDPDDPLTVYGWDAIDITFANCDVGSINVSDFTVSTTSGIPAPVIAGIDYNGGDRVTLHLAEPIAPGGWTCIAHADGDQVCLGYLPGDADQSQVPTAADVLWIFDNLNGDIAGNQPWQTDIDRSGRDTPEDILREIDLLNGCGSFDPWNYISIAQCPSVEY